MTGDPLRIPMKELSVLPAPLAGKEGRAVPPQTPSPLSAFGPRAVSDVAVSYTHLTLPTNREV